MPLMGLLNHGIVFCFFFESRPWHCSSVGLRQKMCRFFFTYDILGGEERAWQKIAGPPQGPCRSLASCILVEPDAASRGGRLYPQADRKKSQRTTSFFFLSSDVMCATGRVEGLTRTAVFFQRLLHWGGLHYQCTPHPQTWFIWEKSQIIW